MPYCISNECIACGTCQSVCPADAITVGSSYSINANLCLECGTCADACPVGAIHEGESKSSTNTNAFTSSNYESKSDEDARESMRNINLETKMDKTMQCPNCGNYVEGKKIKSYSNKVARQGAKSLVHGATSMGGTATGAAIGSAILPGIGTVLGAAAGFIGSAMFNQKVNESIDKAGDYIEDEFVDMEYEFTCPKCGKRWTSAQNEAFNSSNAPSTPEIGSFVLITGRKLIGNAHIQLSNNFSQVMGIALKQRFFSIIESHFGVTIPDEIRKSLKTYENVSDYVSKVIAVKTDSLSDAGKPLVGQYIQSIVSRLIGISSFSLSNNISQMMGQATKERLFSIIESDFGFRIPINVINGFKTYQDIVDYLSSVDETKTDLSQALKPTTNTKITTNQEPQSSKSEQKYIEALKEFLEEGEIRERERRMLDRMRQSLGISEQRAAELEVSLKKPQLTEDEREYLDMYREYAEEGAITEKIRNRLDRFASALGISPERVKQLETL